MRTITSLVALLLLLLYVGGPQIQATEHPEGWTDPASAHPWGGDETPDNPGDNNLTATGRGSAASASLYSNPLLDFILYHFILPTEPAIVEQSRPVFEESADRTPRYRSVRKYETKNRLR